MWFACKLYSCYSKTLIRYTNYSLKSTQQKTYSISHLLGTVTTQWVDSDGVVTVIADRRELILVQLWSDATWLGDKPKASVTSAAWGYKNEGPCAIYRVGSKLVWKHHKAYKVNQSQNSTYRNLNSCIQRKHDNRYTMSPSGQETHLWHDQGEWVGCREYWFWVTG